MLTILSYQPNNLIAKRKSMQLEPTFADRKLRALVPGSGPSYLDLPLEKSSFLHMKNKTFGRVAGMWAN